MSIIVWKLSDRRNSAVDTLYYIRKLLRNLNIFRIIFDLQYRVCYYEYQRLLNQTIVKHGTVICLIHLFFNHCFFFANVLDFRPAASLVYSQFLMLRFSLRPSLTNLKMWIWLILLKILFVNLTLIKLDFFSSLLLSSPLFLKLSYTFFSF